MPGLLALLLSALSPGCAPLPGWEEVAARAEGHYLIFGELHGTEQSPAVVGEYVCAVSRDASVLVAVELSAVFDEGLQRAWRAPEGAFRSVLLAEVKEIATRHDGLGIAAMVAMLERLHRLKNAGRAISVVAFNGAKDEAQARRFADLPGQEPHESAQAENIRAAAEAGDFDHVVVLVGGLHARKRPVGFDGPTWRPMAMILSEENKVLSLEMAYSGGSAWTCELRQDAVREPGQPITDGMVECAARPVRGRPEHGEPRMQLDRAEDPANDGFYALGEVSASPPADAE